MAGLGGPPYQHQHPTASEGGLCEARVSTLARLTLRRLIQRRLRRAWENLIGRQETHKLPKHSTKACMGEPYRTTGAPQATMVPKSFEWCMPSWFQNPNQYRFLSQKLFPVLQWGVRTFAILVDLLHSALTPYNSLGIQGLIPWKSSHRGRLYTE